MSGSREFRRKNRSKPSLKVPVLPPFFQKITVFIEKRKIYLFLSVKKSVPTNFVFTLKNTLGNMSESGEFKFEP